MDIMRWLGIHNPMRVVQLATKTGQTFRGVMVEQTREVVILRAALIGDEDPISHQERWTRVTPGDVVIPWDNVDWWSDGIPASILE